MQLINRKQTTTNTSERASQKSVPMLIKTVLWFAFYGCLATSIPHVAWSLHQFENAASNTVTIFGLSIDLQWVVNIAVATGIDVTVAALAYLLETGVSNASRGTLWSMTIVLLLFSWYCNFVYVIAHSPNLTGVWGAKFGFGIVSNGYLAPIIFSATPLFTLAYTFIIQIVGNSQHLTPEEMQQKLTTLTADITYKASVKRLRDESRVHSVQSSIGSVRAIFGSKGQPQEENASPTEYVQVSELPETPIEATTEPIPVIDTADSSTPTVTPPEVKESIPEYIPYYLRS